MKRNSWKRLLAIMGAASILTVSINPVRINAGGSDLPIVSAEVNAEASPDNTETTSSETSEPRTEIQTETQMETASNTEASPSSSDAADSVPGSDNSSSDSNAQEDTAGSDGADAEASTSEQTTYDTADGSDAAGTDASSASSDEKTGESGTEKSTADASTKSSEEADTEDTKADETDKKAETRITVKYQSADKTMGSVTLSEEEGKAEGNSEEVTFQGSTAKPNEGYEFVDWTLEQDGEMVEVSTDAVFAPTDVTEDTTYFANFEKEKESKTITVTYAAGEGGKVSPESESFQTGSESEIQLTGSTAVANEGYTFLGWVKGEGSGKDRTYVSTDAAFVPDASAITEDTTYTAVFEKKEGEKTAEVDLADYVDGLKVYYRTSSDDPWTEAVITGEELTSIPQTAELKFEFTLSRLTKAGDYTYEIPEFLTDASLEDLEDGAFTSEDVEGTSAAEITTTGSDAEDSDTADTSKLVLHLNKEDAAKELTGAHLTFTAAPNTDKLTTAADRTRTLTFGDRTYTLSFAQLLKKMAAFMNAPEPIKLGDYITKAEVSWKNGETWTPVTSSVDIPLNVTFQIIATFENIPLTELEAHNYTLVYTLPALLKNPAVTTGIVKGRDEEQIGTITASTEDGTITIAYDQDKLKESFGDSKVEGISLGHLTFTATPDPELVRQNYTQKLKIGNADEITVYFDENYDAKNGTLNLTKSKPTYLENGSNSYLQYTLTLKSGDVPMKGIKVVDQFVSPNNQAVESYIGVSTSESKLTSSTDGDIYETLQDGAEHGTVKVDKEENEAGPGELIWSGFDMGANETRTLTYCVKLKKGYAGAAAGEKGRLTNTATPYSDSYPHEAATSNFVPTTDASVTKKAGIVEIEDDYVVVPYTITVTASSNNSWTLRNVKISDYLGDSNTNLNLGKNLWNLIASWDKFQLYNSNYATGTAESVPLKEQNDQSTPYYVMKSTTKEYPGFNLYIGDLHAGDSKTVTFEVKFKKTILNMALNTKDYTVQIGNRAIAFSDDTNSTYGNNMFSGGSATQTELTSQKWDRKVQGEINNSAVSQTIPDSYYVYSGESKSWTQENRDTSKDATISIPAGNVKYQVVVNEKGQWNVSSALFKDQLSNGKYINYAGYMRVDYFQQDLVAGVSFDSDQSAVNALEGMSPTKTFWLKVDGTSSFEFTPTNLVGENLGAGAYLLTYYAVASGTVKGDYTTIQATNSFTLSGSVYGPGGGDVLNLPGVTVSTSVTLTGSLNLNISKQGWYASIGSDTSGALYWVIALNGSKIPSGTQLQDTTDGKSTLDVNSVVGVYKSKNTPSYFTADKNKSILTDNNRFENIAKENNWSWDGSIFTFNNGMALNSDEYLYIVVKTSPKDSAFIGARPTASFTNNLKVRFDNNSSFLDNHVAILSNITKVTTNFKEIGEYGTYNASTKKWTNTHQFINDNNPIDKILTSWKTSTDRGAASQNLHSGTYIDFRLNLNYKLDESGAFLVEDMVPQGLEPVYVRYFWTSPNNTNSDNRPKLEQLFSLNDGWQDIGVKNAKLDGGAQKITENAYAYYNSNEEKIVFKETGLVNGAYGRMEVQVVMRVTDPQLLLCGGSKEFTNTMNVYQSNKLISTSSATGTVVVPDNSLAKDHTNLDFTITVNQLGEDLLTGSDTITLIDKYSDNLEIDPSTIKVKAVNANDSSEKVDFDVEMDPTNHTMTFTIPDNKYLKITYSGMTQGAIGTTDHITNTAYWKGYESSYKKETSFDYTVKADADSDFSVSPTITITKTDLQNATQGLSGATFELYDTVYYSGKFQATRDALETLTTDNNGIVKFGNTSSSSSLKYNHIYCVVEKTAPSGYVKSTEPLYVGVFKSVIVDGETLYPKDLTNDDSKSYSKENSWTSDEIGKWDDVKINYTNSVFKYAWYNEKTKLLVNKTFQDENGNTVDFPDGTYKFGLYTENELVQKLTIQKQHGKFTYLLEVGNTTVTVDQPEFMGFDETKSYDVYELNDEGKPVMNARMIYTNRAQYTVSYQRDTSSQTVNVINKEYSIPITGLHVSGDIPYVVGTVVLAGVFVAYVFWMRRRRT